MKRKITILLSALMITAVSYSQTVGNSAPDFTVSLLSGGDFKLSDKQGKVVMIFFFGNSCSPCIQAAPSVKQQILDVYSSNSDFEAIGIDVWDGSASQVTSFDNQTMMDIPLGLDGSTIANSYNSQRDRLLVIDKEGMLRHNTTNNAANDISNVKSVISQYLEGSASVQDINSSKEVSIYPNPVQDYLYLEFNFEQSGIAELKIVDLTGKLVKQEQYTLDSGIQSRQFEVNDLPAGFYLLTIKSNNKSYISKITVNRF